MTSDAVASVRYRAASPADHEAIATLVSTVWPERKVDASRVAAWVRGSATSLVAVAGSDIIGFVRVISDNVSSALIAMLVVDEAWRRRGVGRALVLRVTDSFANPEITWVLRSRVGSEAF